MTVPQPVTADDHDRIADLTPPRLEVIDTFIIEFTEVHDLIPRPIGLRPLPDGRALGDRAIGDRAIGDRAIARHDRSLGKIGGLLEISAGEYVHRGIEQQ